VVNRAYLFRKNFPQTRRARAGFAALLLMLCGHRVLNRDWSGLGGLLEGIWLARRSEAAHPARQERVNARTESLCGAHGDVSR
jgi:hypothetical protein